MKICQEFKKLLGSKNTCTWLTRNYSRPYVVHTALSPHHSQFFNLAENNEPISLWNGICLFPKQHKQFRAVRNSACSEPANRARRATTLLMLIKDCSNPFHHIRSNSATVHRLYKGNNWIGSVVVM